MLTNKPKETLDTSTPVHSTGRQEVTTIFSEGCRFEGNMFTPANTRLDGEVKGNISGDSMLVIGEKGRIGGDVMAVDVIVFGTVEGSIKSRKLELKRGCRVTGDVYVDLLFIEEGSFFNGKCVMEQKPSPKSQAVQQT